LREEDFEKRELEGTSQVYIRAQDAKRTP